MNINILNIYTVCINIYNSTILIYKLFKWAKSMHVYVQFCSKEELLKQNI